MNRGKTAHRGGTQRRWADLAGPHEQDETAGNENHAERRDPERSLQEILAGLGIVLGQSPVILARNTERTGGKEPDKKRKRGDEGGDSHRETGERPHGLFTRHPAIRLTRKTKVRGDPGGKLRAKNKNRRYRGGQDGKVNQTGQFPHQAAAWLPATTSQARIHQREMMPLIT